MKKDKLWLILILTILLMILTTSASSDSRTSITGASMSGGNYILTIHQQDYAQPAGYQLQSVATPQASGCCCKTYMPCIQR